MTTAAALAACAAGSGAVGLVDVLGGLAPRRLRRSPARSRTPASMRLLAAAGARLRAAAGARAPVSLEVRIAAAGAMPGLGPREVMAAKLAGALAAAPLGTLLAAAAPGRLGPLVLVATPLAGFLAPDWWLSRRARERARAVRRDLPALLDLLRVSVEAGLAPAAALSAVAERATGPLAAEWGTVAREVELGVPLTVAVERSAARLPLPEIRDLAAAITRASRHGTPLGRTLAAQAGEARAARRRRIEEEAARAGPKIQLVVALLLVPSVLLLVAAALAAALLGGGADPLPVGP
jgi:tight adherence protein C